MNETESELAQSFAQVAEELARFEAKAASLLRDPELPAVHKRDLRDRIEVMAERARRHASALREGFALEGFALAGGRMEHATDRIDRLFLVEMEANLEEGFRFMQRRLGLEGESTPPPSQEDADRALRSLESEYAPRAASLDALGLVAERAASLAARAKGRRDEDERRLDRALLEVKRKAFMPLAELAKAQNPELLFKCRLAFEANLKADTPPLIGPEAQYEGRMALLPGPGGALRSELFERGLRLRLEFRPSAQAALPAGSVEGWVESGGERADFRLEDPRRVPSSEPKSGRPADTRSAAPSAPSAPAGFIEFLAAYDLSYLYGELSARAVKLEAEASGREDEDSPASRLSAALDDLL